MKHRKSFEKKNIFLIIKKSIKCKKKHYERNVEYKLFKKPKNKNIDEYFN